MVAPKVVIKKVMIKLHKIKMILEWKTIISMKKKNIYS